MKILLIRLSSFGDIVLTTPVVRALRERYPDAVIDFVVYDRFVAALSSHPEINKLFVLPKKRLKQCLKKKDFVQFWQILAGFVHELRRTRYDHVIDLHNVTESALVAICARGRFRAGHRKQLLSLFFSTRSDFDDGFASAQMHAAESNLQFLVDAGCLEKADLPAKPRLEFFIPDAAVSALDTYLVQQGLVGKKLAGINPCASYDFKRWHETGFAVVADYLAKLGYTILLFGSPSEQGIIQQVAANMKYPAVDTSQLPLFEAFELIRRLNIFVTNDSAPMHIAAAFETPLIAIHGPINMRKFYPLSERARSISKSLSCLPCKSAKDCATRECFGIVTSEEVCSACRELIDGISTGVVDKDGLSE